MAGKMWYIVLSREKERFTARSFLFNATGKKEV
jgi:hypothetical protein